ncbi:hypothetical protein BFP78_10800 [Gaetbulibacter sp. 5U11]|nr:hypothetical protein BFP78_10800 [Gaetbulibacter sp. 5U11]
MKQFYLLLSFLITAFSYAQLTPPTELQAYYNGVDFTKTQLDLFNDLAVVTAVNHTNSLSYTPGIWEASKMTDEDTDNSNNVRLFYGYSDTDNNHVTDRTRNKNLNGGNSGTDWNREHVFPNSLANPSLDSSGSSGPPYADGHNLRPSDVQMNSNRGNKKFAAGSGNAGNTSSGSSLWYPGDEYKGDAARIIMYMYTRYGSQCLPTYAVNGTTNSIDPNMINILLDWNAEDPVSLIEDNRNTYHANTSNTYAQGNRNPFIDNPYLATVIWGGTPAENRWGSQPPTDTQAPSTPLNLVANNPTETTIDLSWTASTDDTAVTTYDVYVDGTYYTNTGSDATTFTVTGLSAETSYTFTILAKDAAGNSSGLSNSVNETTLVGSSASNDLFLSEYMEGSSNNKALEIANFTGNAITDLSAYELRISSNGNAAWTGTYNFPASASIANNDVYVIGNGSLAVCTGVVDNSNNTITGFNGNDAIGLFKNGVLIDIIGTLGDGATFGANTTLVRNPSIAAGNIAFDINEWTASASNTCTDLGQHTVAALSITQVEVDNFKIYPNPVRGSLLNIEVKQNTRFEIYDILGKKILQGNVTQTNKQVSVSRLNKGVYILRLKNESGSVTKKLIKD